MGLTISKSIKSLKTSIIPKNGFWPFLRTNMAYISLFLLVIIFRIWAGPNFLSLRNWTFIAQQAPVLMTLAIAQTFAITGGFIDLSVGSVVGLSCYLSALGLSYFGPPGLLLGLLAATLVGLLNGAIFSFLKIPSFITTLATMVIIRASVLIISNGKAIYIAEGLVTRGLSAEWLTSLGRFPKILIPTGIVIVFAWVMYTKTVFGRDLQAIGGNEIIVGLFGVSITKFKLFIFSFIGFIVGIGSLINLARIGAATPVTGQGLELDVISAVVLGGTPLTGGYGSIPKTVVGTISLVVLANGLTIAGVPPSWNNVARGLLLIIAVAISLDRKKIGVVK